MTTLSPTTRRVAGGIVPGATGHVTSVRGVGRSLLDVAHPVPPVARVPSAVGRDLLGTMRTQTPASLIRIA